MYRRNLCYEPVMVEVYLHECAVHQRKHGSLQPVCASHVVIVKDTVGELVLTLQFFLYQVHC